MKKILIIDGQGGMLGKQLVENIKKRLPQAEITAVGANIAATGSMLKAGADNAATGENAVAVCARTADIIAGPVGIAIADSLLGEITPRMAEAVGQSTASKVLISVNRCSSIIVGTGGKKTSELLAEAVDTIERLCCQE